MDSILTGGDFVSRAEYEDGARAAVCAAAISWVLIEENSGFHVCLCCFGFCSRMGAAYTYSYVRRYRNETDFQWSPIANAIGLFAVGLAFDYHGADLVGQADVLANALSHISEDLLRARRR